MVAILSSLYALGVLSYVLSSGKFKNLLTVISAVVGPLYILIFLFLTAAGGGGYGLSGPGILLIFAAPIGIPCSGYISAFFGDLLLQSSSKKWLGIVFCGIAISILPSILHFMISTSPKLKQHKIKKTAIAKTYAVNFNGKRLLLPCRREFHLFRPEKQCFYNDRDKSFHFLYIDKLSIWPKGHADGRSYCQDDKSDKVQKSLFCQFKSLDYNVDFIIPNRKYVENVSKRYGIESEIQASDLDRLIIVSEEIKDSGNDRRPSSVLHLLKHYSNNSKYIFTAHVFCVASYYKDKPESYDCNIKLSLGTGLWAESMRFSARPDSIETQVDKVSKEVPQYFHDLLVSYEIDKIEKR